MCQTLFLASKGTQLNSTINVLKCPLLYVVRLLQRIVVLALVLRKAVHDQNFPSMRFSWCWQIEPLKLAVRDSAVRLLNLFHNQP